MEFELKKLDDIEIEIIDGDRGKKYPNGDDFRKEKYCLFLNAKNVTTKGFNFDKTIFINKEKDNELRKGKLKRNDIVLTTRGTVGNVGYYSNEISYENIRINSGMLILRCNPKVINPKYLYYVLKSKHIQNEIKQVKTGSAQPQLPIEILKNIKINLTNIEIQKKIVTILDSFDKKIELNNKMNMVLYEIIHQLYNNVIKDGGNWEEIELENIVEISSGKRPKEKMNKGKYPIIGANGKMGYTSDYNIFEDVIIIGRVGTLGIVKRYCNKEWASDNTLIIKTEYKNYIENYLKTIDYNSLNRGSTQPLITQSDLKRQKILFNKNRIIKFESIVQKIVNKIRYIDNENQVLEQLRDTLLPKLMNGKIKLDKI